MTATPSAHTRPRCGHRPRPEHVSRPPSPALGVAHAGLSDLRIVPDMATRKKHLASAADAVIALPGGFGTLDGLAYVWSGSALAVFPPRPVGLLDTGGFYRPLVTFVRTAVAQGFLALHDHLPLDEMLLADDDLAQLIRTLLARVPAAPEAEDDITTAA
ncbi:LOG family protein (plasmid) [Actinacidiphila glaucinigra]|uniref:LOG family protein n=1 Tax=Actinacidiphila glaucinigra TaxID=235986 RepID=UPI002DDB6D62|nr:LOG family protein [Actinacidiphila glaucinigra]WSD65730.1 LOG family protein [Actinacidiphila glaucinigra]WSD65982.1 LOG family protein [Actinacidiphila glaucinigra]